MNVYVIGVATAPPSFAEHRLRLEELAYYTSRSALDNAGVSRSRIDSLTIASCDELDGRPISSMLMSAAAGGYETDEVKVTDAGASALCLAYARFLSQESQLGLVVSWCKSSKTDVEEVMRQRGDPFYTRPLGINAMVSDAMFAQAVGEEFGITEEDAAQRVVAGYQRASHNPRGMRHPVPTLQSIAQSPMQAVPLRSGQRAPLTDGAVALVLASESFVKRNPSCVPLARIAGAGWCSDSYRIDAQRLRGMNSARTAWRSAMTQAGLASAADLDVVELECPTGYHEAAYAQALGITDERTLSPSGGAFAQNPLFCTGLVNAAEAVLQVAGKAGPVQRAGVKRAAAHSCHGYAQQGNIVMLFESPKEAQ